MGMWFELFTPTGLNQVRMFLILFCVTLAGQVLLNFRDQLAYFQTAPMRVYGEPLLVLGRYKLPTPSTRQFRGAGIGLILSLLCATVGWYPQLFLLLALSCYFVYFRPILSLAYVQRKTNLIPLVLVILLFSPAVAQPLNQAAPLWPLVLIKIALVQMYLSAGLQKLRHAGWQWCDGKSLQAYLFEHYLWGDTKAAWWLAQQPRLCQILSSGALLFELTFVLVLVFPALTIAYVLAGLLFHAGTGVTMRIHYLKYLSPVYLVFATELAFFVWHNI